MGHAGTRSGSHKNARIDAGCDVIATRVDSRQESCRASEGAWVKTLERYFASSLAPKRFITGAE